LTSTNSYEGVSNLKTVNDGRPGLGRCRWTGGSSILLLFCRELYEEHGGR
jgi:thiamine biosynthesis lipoprotein